MEKYDVCKINGTRWAVGKTTTEPRKYTFANGPMTMEVFCGYLNHSGNWVKFYSNPPPKDIQYDTQDDAEVALAMHMLRESAEAIR